MPVHVLIAEHFETPGIVVQVHASAQGAESAAADLVNIMLKDAGDVGNATAKTWPDRLLWMQEYYGAAHCYVEILVRPILD